MTEIGEIDNNSIAAECERRDKRFKKAWMEYTYIVRDKIGKEMKLKAEEKKAQQTQLAIENGRQTEVIRIKLKPISRCRPTQMSNGNLTKTTNATAMEKRAEHSTSRVDIPNEAKRTNRKAVLQPKQMLNNKILTEITAAIGVIKSRKRNASTIEATDKPIAKKFKVKFGSKSEIRIDENKLRECGLTKYKMEIKFISDEKKAVIRKERKL